MNENREETLGGSSCEKDKSAATVDDTQSCETAKTFKDLVGWMFKLGLVPNCSQLCCIHREFKVHLFVVVLTLLVQVVLNFRYPQGVTEVLCDACEQLGWKSPTKIQVEAVPVALQGECKAACPSAEPIDNTAIAATMHVNSVQLLGRNSTKNGIISVEFLFLIKRNTTSAILLGEGRKIGDAVPEH